MEGVENSDERVFFRSGRILHGTLDADTCFGRNVAFGRFRWRFRRQTYAAWKGSENEPKHMVPRR